MNKLLFLSGSEPKAINRLNTLGYKTIICKPNVSLDEPIKSHADCALFKIDRTYFVEEGNYFNIVNSLTIGERYEKKTDREIIKIEAIKSPYPNDVLLNAKMFGSKILCNTDFLSLKVKEYAERNGYELMHCNQGYAACSTVKLSDNAAITDDNSVYNMLRLNGIDSIIVSKGSVKLNGYDYGFIGGCCGLIEKNLLAFVGSIDNHADSMQIINFLHKHGIDYIDLFDGELIDIGGIMML